MIRACFPFFNKKNHSKSLTLKEIIACIQSICVHYTSEPFQSINNLLLASYSYDSDIQLSEKNLFVLVSVMAKAREPFEEDSGVSICNHLNGNLNKNAFLAWWAQRSGMKNFSEKVKKVISRLQENSVGMASGWQHVEPQDFAKILRDQSISRKGSTYITAEKSPLLRFCCIQSSPISAVSSRATSPASSRVASPLTVGSEDTNYSRIDSYSLNRN